MVWVPETGSCGVHCPAPTHLEREAPCTEGSLVALVTVLVRSRRAMNLASVVLCHQLTMLGRTIDRPTADRARPQPASRDLLDPPIVYGWWAVTLAGDTAHRPHWPVGPVPYESVPTRKPWSCAMEPGSATSSSLRQFILRVQQPSERGHAHRKHRWIGVPVVPSGPERLLEGPRTRSLPFEVVACERVAEHCPRALVEQVPCRDGVECGVGRPEATGV